jgi:hypothetical protein
LIKEIKLVNEPVPKLIDCALMRTVLEQALGKTGQKPRFSLKSREAVPKTAVLEQPQMTSPCFLSVLSEDRTIDTLCMKTGYIRTKAKFFLLYKISMFGIIFSCVRPNQP